MGDINIKLKLKTEVNTPGSQEGFKKPGNANPKPQQISRSNESSQQSAIGSFSGGQFNNPTPKPQPTKTEESRILTAPKTEPQESSMIGGFGPSVVTPKPAQPKPTVSPAPVSTPSSQNTSSNTEKEKNKLKDKIATNEEEKRRLLVSRQSIGKYVAGIAVCGGIAFFCLFLDFLLGMMDLLPVFWIVFLIVIAIVLIIVLFSFIPKVKLIKQTNSQIMSQVRKINDEITDLKADLRYLEHKNAQ